MNACQTAQWPNHINSTLHSAIVGKLQRDKYKSELRALIPFSIYSKTIPLVVDSEQKKFTIHRELGVVIKNDKLPKTHRRFKNNLLVSRFLYDNGFISVVVPRSRLHGNVVIDEIIPVVDRDYIADLGFYIENFRAFDQAIEEFFTLLCHIRILDIRGGNNIPYKTLLKDQNYGRYDNVCLYLEEGKGKLGLIDLEFVEVGAVKDARSLFFILQDLISLFPLHYELIVKLGLRKFPEIENYESKLKQINEELEAYLKAVYYDHKAWHQTKGIAKEPSKSITIDDRDALRAKVFEILSKRLSVEEAKLFLDSDYEATVTALLNGLNAKLKQISAETAPEIIAARTIIGQRNNSKSAICVDAILLALKETGSIYDYKPCFGERQFAKPTVFC